MNKSDGYKPVSCAAHSEYELVIMHKRKLKISWLNAKGNTVTEEVLPTDMITRDHAEYLLVIDQDNTHKEIRLDKIIEAHQVE